MMMVFLAVFLLTFISPYTVEAGTSQSDYLKREHSLVRPYQPGGSFRIPHWDFGGSTMVTSNYIRLTPDQQGKRGAIFNSAPLMLHNWELHVHFKVHGRGRDLSGDGMAVWYAKHKLVLGDVFGTENGFVGLGIFFDSYANQVSHNRVFPYVSAMVNDGSLKYIHDVDGTTTEIGGCEAQYRNVKHDTYVAIRYVDEVLTVSLDVDRKGNWKECFKVPGVRLPTGYYLGASAGTGDLSDNHDLISMKLYELDGNTDPNAYINIVPSVTNLKNIMEDRSDAHKSGGGSVGSSFWKIFLIIIIVLIVVVIVAIIGWVLVQKQQDHNKRLY